MKTVLITGGAKRIGKEIALHLARQGWKVIIHYNHSYQEAHQLAKEINGILIQADLANEQDLKEIFNKIDGKIDLLINNAAVFEKSVNDPSFYRKLADIFSINLYAPMQLSMGYLNRYSGNIINILDASLEEYSEDFIGYCLSKKALGEFTQKLASSNKANRSRINALALGMCLIKEGQSREVFDKIAKKYPTHIKDVCQGVDYILSNKTISGEILDLTKWN